MNNTIMTAKNTFSEGLIMDMAPDNTQANTLTSALNATLLTFNGNEMSLQNDMGNGRVETARLPEGFVPIGTCEFGDIIYIVSYNPLTNKSQIGCFPSPERNISSDEITDTKLILSCEDFQELNIDNTPTGKLKTMSVKKILIGSKNLNPGDKYIIYNDDKEGISGNTISDYGNSSHKYGEWPKLVKIHVVSINESGKITYLDQDVKWYDNFFIKEKVANNAEGKPDLDAYRTLVDSAYSIFQSKNSGKLAIIAELESIKSFNCTYSINAHKNGLENRCEVYLHTSWDTDNYNINPSGIAILKSEWVGTNGGTYIYYDNTGKALNGSMTLPISKTGNDIYKEYSRIYTPELSINYNDFKNNNYYTEVKKNWKEHSKITLALNNGDFIRENNQGRYYLDLKYVKKNEQGNLVYYDINNKEISQPELISDDIVNNYFKKDITIPLITYNIPSFSNVKEEEIPNDLSNLIWKIRVAPCMPYGVLEQYAIDLIIDFSKVGKNIIDFKEWKYYNSGDLSTLTYGFDVNLDKTQKVKNITIDFYDNQGIAATYVNDNKTSYSGSFTERLGLNGTNINYKLRDVDSSGNKIYHAGLPYTSNDYQGDLVYWNEVSKPVKFDSSVHKDGNNIFINDAGSLYANFLYKTVITISYGVVNELGDFINILKKQYSRWFWTNSIYNSYYYSTPDFNILSFDLELASQYELKSCDNYSIKTVKYYNLKMNEEIKEGDDIETKSLGALITCINLDSKNNDNLLLKVKVGLKDSYNTFYLNNNKDLWKNINVLMLLGNSKIECDEQSFQAEEELIENVAKLKSIINMNNKGIVPESGPILEQLLKGTTTSKKLELWGGLESYKNYADSFKISSSESSESIVGQKYLNPEDGKEYNIVFSTNKPYDTESKEGFKLTLTGIMFNKQCFNKVSEIKGQYPVVKTIARSQSNRDNLNISYDNAAGLFYFNKVLAMNLGGHSDGAVLTRYFSKINESNAPQEEVEIGNSGLVNVNTERLTTGISKLGLTSPLLLTIWSDYSDDRRMGYKGTWLKSPFSSREDLRLAIGINNSDLVHSALFLLGINSPDKSFYPLNEMTVLGLDYNEFPFKLTQEDGNNSIANLVVSVLSNLYYCTQELETYVYNKLSNLNYVKDFSETWKQHIIINTSVNDIAIPLDLISFYNGYSLNEYIEDVNKYFPQEKSFINKGSNIKIAINPNKYIIDFQYTVNSNNRLQEVYNEFSNLEIQSLIYKADSKTPSVSDRTYNNNLFWENEKGDLLELTKDFKYKLQNSWNWENKEILNNLDRIDNGDLLTTESLTTGSSNIKTINNFGKWFGYDEKSLIKMKNYPYTEMVQISNYENGEHGWSRFNFSATPVFTGLNKAIKA